MNIKLISEGNILIAEFLHERRPNLDLDPVNYYHYHKDWGWLAPAIIKCKKLYRNKEFDKNIQLLENALMEFDIEEVYKVIINLIKHEQVLRNI